MSSPPNKGELKSQENAKRNEGDFVDRCKRIPALGVLLAVAGGVAFALTLTLVKVSGVFPLVVLFERSVLQLMFFLSAVVFSGHRWLGIPNKNAFLLSCLAAIFGGLFPVLCHLSMYFIPVADIVAIFFASPAFITLYTCAATRRNPGIYRIAVLGLALSGVVIVTKPTFIFGLDSDTSHLSWLEGCLLAIGSSVAYSGFCVSCNHCKNIPVESLNFLISAFTLLLNVPVLMSLNKFNMPTCGSEGAYALASAITGIFAVLFLILATKLENAGPVAIGNAAELPAVIVFQVIMTKEVPSWNSYLGSALIVTSVLISGWLRWQEDKKITYNVVPVMLDKNPASDTKIRRHSVDLSLLEESAV